MSAVMTPDAINRAGQPFIPLDTSRTHVRNQTLDESTPRKMGQIQL